METQCPQIHQVVTTNNPNNQPNPTDFASPDVCSPQELLIHYLLLDYGVTLLFIVILVAIVGSSERLCGQFGDPKSCVISRSFTQETEETTVTEDETGKFCIFCGSSNKGVRQFIERNCGKQIGGL